MAKEYVPIYFDWIEVTQDLTAEEKGNLIDAVVSYASGREYEHLLCGACKIAFRFLKGQVDRNAAISDIRKQARQGKTQQPTTEPIKTEQPTTNDNKTQQTESNFPKEKEKEKEKEKKKEEELLFARFWDAYPKHTAKTAARKAFDKVNPDAAKVETMLAAIEKQKASAQWQENGGQFIPYPATWLNQNRWEDELPKPTAGNGKTVVAQQYTQRDYTGTKETFDSLYDRLGV